MSTMSQLIRSLYQELTDCYYRYANQVEMESQLTEHDLFYLDILYQHERLSPSDFARYARISRPAASQLIQKFQEKGYLTKIVSESDKRRSTLHLSQELRHYFQESNQILDTLFDQLWNDFNDSELQQAKELIGKMLNNVRKQDTHD